MSTRLNRVLKLAAFKCNQRIYGIGVPDTPLFGDPASNGYFYERLSQSRFYWEYGCGGSTILAAKLRKRFISIESDPYYLSCVRKKIANEIGNISGHLIHVNIGITEEWGRPFIKRQTAKRISRWTEYAATPWRISQDAPDLILVDGRFRVLCALYAAYQSPNRCVEILFDDYIGRPYYKEIERFLKIEKIVGNMACMSLLDFDPYELQEAIVSFGGQYM